MWGLAHAPPLPRGQEGSAPHFILVTTSARGVTARDALCVKGQGDTQDWKYEKLCGPKAEREGGQDHKGHRSPSGLKLRQWGHGERAEQLQEGIQFQGANEQHLQPVQDGEQEEPKVPLWVAASGVMSTRHTRRTGGYGCVSVLVHLHTHSFLLRPLRETSSITPQPSPQGQATHTAE